MATVYIAVGSNIGNRQDFLRAAVKQMENLPGTYVKSTSTWHETEPVGTPAGSGKFLNGAVALETNLGAEELLAELLRIEREMGRQRHEGIKNAPRVIDLDLIMYEGLRISTESLTLPHARMHQRRFVLEPLAEIAADAVHPTIGLTVRELLARLP